MNVPAKDLKPLYDAILHHVPAPEVDVTAPLQMLVVTLDYSDYVGRIAVGKVFAGKIRKGQRISHMKHDGQRVETTVKQLYVFDRLGRIEADEVAAGDICAVVGIEGVDIGDTLADLEKPVALPPITVDEPTLEMLFRINDSPFVGQDGTYVTSRQLRERLMKELESNVALRVTADEVKRDEFHVAGRGLLHLSILLENMRREGFEVSVGKPRVINKEVNGVLMEPIEYLVIEVPPASVGVGDGAGGQSAGRVREDEWPRRLDAHRIHDPGARPDRPADAADDGDERRGHRPPQLLRLSTDARHIPARSNGVMISTETGRATPFALDNLQDRGSLFIAGGDQVYEGQIVGEHCRDNDLPRERLPREEADEHAGVRHGQGRDPEAAAADDAGAGAGVHRGR